RPRATAGVGRRRIDVNAPRCRTHAARTACLPVLCGLAAVAAIAPALAGCGSVPGGARGPRGSVFLFTPRPRPGSSLAAAPAISGAEIDRRLAETGAATGGALDISLAWNS